MKRSLLSAIILVIFFSVLKSQELKSPDEFLGYKLGTQFTFQHRAIEYFKYIADNSPRAIFREYGKTYEGRQLGVCIISSEENLAKLEEYRKNNLIKAGLLKGEFTGKQMPFIWLAYNIHGSEAVGMEAAMKTLYTLVTGSYPGVSEYLKECIIIIDPCQNPDGHDLYTERYRTSMNRGENPDKNSWEHNQGWPPARTNHYMFDLNRDWVWQTQAETQQRIIFYSQFMPQVHADFHEMGPESTYFFAPSADPWNTVFTPWQHEFHKLMGKGNAALFNEKFRLYFTREDYDFFYPAYGDTWPSLNGAIGFTYEQGGGGSAGIAYKQESGDTLTLKKRIEGHFTSSMATIKVSYENREKLISEYDKFFDESSKNPQFQYKSVIIKGANDRSDMSALLKLLDRNQIKYTYAGNTGKKLKGFDYYLHKSGEVTVEKGDILISAYQPQSHLMQVLFEPDCKISDSLSYDITSWSVPYVYNIKAFAANDKVAADTGKVEQREIENKQGEKSTYAYITNFTGFNELKFIAALYKKSVKLRYSLYPVTLDGKSYNRGSIIIARGDNTNLTGDFDRIVANAANDCQAYLTVTSTGLVDSGKDFGSQYSPLMKKRDVAILCGEGTSPLSAGELWFFFERELNYPVSLINTEITRNPDLRKYEILILSSGNYTKLKDTIVDWVKRGGRVIALESAISTFSGIKTTALAKAIETRAAEQKAAEKKIKSDDTTMLKKYEYENEGRYRLSDRSEGSIYKAKLDDTHPYAFGIGKEWYTIKRSPGYPFLDKGSNIVYILDKDPVTGFAGYKFKEKVKNTIVIGSETIGEGQVIYITDDPYFRGFWKSGRVLLGNMILR
jgi:hypothetical protein